MTSDSKPYVPFSQRTGLEPIPPQLKLGEVSQELRRLLDYYLALEIDRETRYGTESGYFTKNWERVAQDLHVKYFEQMAGKFKNSPYDWKQKLNTSILRANIGELFNMVEFVLHHENCSVELKKDIRDAFVTARAAYRVFDNQYIAAIGTEEQAAAFERAVTEAEARNATAARMHLIKAGVALRNSEWADSVRESIHAVEAMAVRLAPNTKDLQGAIRVLEVNGHLHGSLKKAFDLLYAYSSNEEGIRHANILSDKAQVDEADALFMQGACASFVSYLLARST
jgi:hypothetical protein